MSAALAARTGAPLEGAVVVGAEIVAGHDGAADLLVRLRHENGVEATVTLDPATGFDLLEAAGAARLDDLVGRLWLDILKELSRV
ncbi:MAG TPA: hypothetical protein VMT68_12600 [Caulobacteraceae bacterium]|nr:hypothetical protein [Caulobacteraceae bacterium]